MFVARQPILDRRKGLFAYELLCRASLDADSCLASSDQASARVFTNAITTIGLDALTHGRRAFVNVTRRLLLDGMVTAIPPSCIVVELLEDIEADADVLEACRELKRQGYALALDDFALSDRTAELVPLADFIKVDFLGSDAQQRQAIVEATRDGHPALLAEKVETLEVFEAARDAGYQYFQGFFLGKPVTEQARDVPKGRMAALSLVAALSDHNLSAVQLESALKHDASLCYRLLRAANSAGVARHGQIHTVRDALVLLGRETVRRWVAVLVLADLGGHGSEDLAAWATVRARFCELVASQARDRGRFSESFLMGMCSLLDVLLGCSMSDVLSHLPLDEASKDALLGHPSAKRDLLECVIAYERGQWTRCLALASDLGIDPDILPQQYAAALRWARSVDPV